MVTKAAMNRTSFAVCDRAFIDLLLKVRDGTLKSIFRRWMEILLEKKKNESVDKNRFSVDLVNSFRLATTLLNDTPGIALLSDALEFLDRLPIEETSRRRDHLINMIKQFGHLLFNSYFFNEVRVAGEDWLAPAVPGMGLDGDTSPHIDSALRKLAQCQEWMHERKLPHRVPEKIIHSYLSQILSLRGGVTPLLHHFAKSDLLRAKARIIYEEAKESLVEFPQREAKNQMRRRYRFLVRRCGNFLGEWNLLYKRDDFESGNFSALTCIITPMETEYSPDPDSRGGACVYMLTSLCANLFTEKDQHRLIKDAKAWIDSQAHDDLPPHRNGFTSEIQQVRLKLSGTNHEASAVQQAKLHERLCDPVGRLLQSEATSSVAAYQVKLNPKGSEHGNSQPALHFTVLNVSSIHRWAVSLFPTGPWVLPHLISNESKQLLPIIDFSKFHRVIDFWTSISKGQRPSLDESLSPIIDFFRVLAPEAREALGNPAQLSALFRTTEVTASSSESPGLRLVFFGTSSTSVEAAFGSREASRLKNAIERLIEAAAGADLPSDPCPEWQLDWLRHEMHESQSSSGYAQPERPLGCIAASMQKLYEKHVDLRAVFIISTKKLFVPDAAPGELIPGYSLLASFYALQEANTRWQGVAQSKLDRITAGRRAEWFPQSQFETSKPYVALNTPQVGGSSHSAPNAFIQDYLPGLVSRCRFDGIPLRIEQQAVAGDERIQATVSEISQQFDLIESEQKRSTVKAESTPLEALPESIVEQISSWLRREHARVCLTDLKSDPGLRSSTLCLTPDESGPDHVLDRIELAVPDSKGHCVQTLSWTNCPGAVRLKATNTMRVNIKPLEAISLRCAFFNTSAILEAHNLSPLCEAIPYKIEFHSAADDISIPGAIPYETSLHWLEVPTAKENNVIANKAKTLELLNQQTCTELFRLSGAVSNHYALERQRYSGFVDVTAHTVINLLNSTNPIDLLTDIKFATKQSSTIGAENSDASQLFRIAKEGLNEIELKKNAAIGALRWNQLLAGSLREKHLARKPYNAVQLLEQAISYFGARGVGCKVAWRDEAIAHRIIFPEKYFHVNMAAYTVYEFLKNLSDHAPRSPNGGILEAIINEKWVTMKLTNRVESESTGEWEETSDGIPIPSNRRKDIAEGNSFLVNLVRFLKNREDLRVRIEVNSLPNPTEHYSYIDFGLFRDQIPYLGAT